MLVIKRRPASTGIISAQTQIIWWKLANNWKWDYCFKSSFHRFSTNINSTTDFYTLWKEGITTIRSKFIVWDYQKNRRIIVLCFIKIHASKILIIRGMAIMILSEIFCPIGPKNFDGVISVFREISSMEQKLWIKNGGLTFFRRWFSVSQFENNSGGTIHCFWKLRVSEPFMYKKEISLFSVENSWPHGAESFFRVPFCFSENSSIDDLHA